MRTWLWKMIVTIGVILAVLYGVERYAIAHDNSGFGKRVAWFGANAGAVKGLVFGPSLLVQAIDPTGLDAPTASLALSASAPDVDTKLLTKALKRSNPDFILFDLTVGTLDRRKPVKYYEQRKLYQYMGIPFEGMQLKDRFFTSYPLYRYFYPDPPEKNYNERGFPTSVKESEDYFRLLDYDPEKIAAEKRLMRKMRKQGLYSDADNALNQRDLKMVIEQCRERDIKFIFLAPPKYRLFNENVEPLHPGRRQAFLDEVVDNETVFFWDYATFGQDEPEYFHNINHTSPLGGQAFTAELNERLNAFLAE
ncbi:hypothetical protein [Lewinella sp. 4G2]|uniref:hypothetical protein n=1 Tax=Lewinella sp. 4G2 TaxID=1803372 RepID=UPI0007B4C065|nr:hypothetical protein [Lewinella sp. 4G2]OAV44838.1 hypothetical protein A3850_010200 [Lewinella sp. 4G2]